jgi:integrase
MATVRKRTWTTRDGKVKTAWIADYYDQHRDGKHPRGHRIIKTFERQKDARAWLDDTKIEVKQKVHTPARQSITIAEAADLWIQHVRDEEKREKSTVVQYQNHVRLHICPMIGDAKLCDLAASDIENFKDAMLRKLSRVMARKVLVSLKGILKNARRKGLMAHTPAADVRIGADKREKGRRRGNMQAGVGFPSKTEMQSILAVMTDQAALTRWLPIIRTAAFTGMRSSELRGLPWDRGVDFRAREIHVFQRADDWHNLGEPKSEAGDRKIPMSPKVCSTLREWKLACPHGELGLVFPTGDGTIENHANITNRGWRAAQIAAGVIKPNGRAKYGFHTLRHFFASWIIERGFSPKRCQVLLGHSSLQMTYDVYGGLFPDDEGDHEKFAAGESAILGA